MYLYKSFPFVIEIWMIISNQYEIKMEINEEIYIVYKIRVIMTFNPDGSVLARKNEYKSVLQILNI